MANTGKKIIITLKRVDQSTGLPDPSHSTKPNDIDDPDYEPPMTDLTACPIVYSTACPVMFATGQANKIEYEFSLDNPVVNNPAILKVRIKALLGMTTIASNVITLPNSTPNYFTGVLTGLAGATSYTVALDYLDGSNNVVASCANLSTVTTT